MKDDPAFHRLGAPAARYPAAAPPALLRDAVRFLSTPPPEVGIDEATRTAALHYPPLPLCTDLAGERDRNFLLTRPDGEQQVLKFINSSESVAETAMQISVLEHLATDSRIPVPRHVPPVSPHASTVTVCLANGSEARVRAYSYLQGTPASSVATEAGLRFEIGRAVGRLSLALAAFDHPAARRVLLWDVSHVSHLASWVGTLSDRPLAAFVVEFLTAFEADGAVRLRELPHQVIHNDLSPSNLLVTADGKAVAGVLDFGDMVRAPAVVDLAVAASYQLSNAVDPVLALGEVVQGFESVKPLNQSERDLLLDLTIARLVQRVVLTEWRAVSFPDNRAYILRSRSAAAASMHRLAGPWRARRMALPRAAAAGVEHDRGGAR